MRAVRGWPEGVEKGGVGSGGWEVAFKLNCEQQQTHRDTNTDIAIEASEHFRLLLCQFPFPFSDACVCNVSSDFDCLIPPVSHFIPP